jgi:PAS domain S-box-containing protein
LEGPAQGLQERQAQANALVTGPQYHAAKADIMHPIGDFYALMEKRSTDFIRAAERDALILRVVFILFGLSLMLMLYRTNNFLRATLGGSIAQVFALITRIGRGNFAPSAPLPQEDENSVMGWLAKTQLRLNKVEHARQAAEEALRENEARYRTLVEGSTDPILAHRDGMLVYLNPASVKALGAANAKVLLGTPLRNIVHPDFHPLSKERIERTVQTGQPAEATETKLVRVDGEVIDVESQSAAVMLDGVMSVQVSPVGFL